MKIETDTILAYETKMWINIDFHKNTDAKTHSYIVEPVSRQTVNHKQ